MRPLLSLASTCKEMIRHYISIPMHKHSIESIPIKSIPVQVVPNACST